MCPQTDPAAFATCALVASRSAGAGPTGTSARSSGPCPPSRQPLPTRTAAPVATVVLPADRSPYKSSPTCIWSLDILSGRGEDHLLVTTVRLQRSNGLGPLMPLLA